MGKQKEIEDRKMPDSWFSDFMSHFPRSGWNNFNNGILNSYWQQGFTPEQAAKRFSTHGM